MADAKEKHHSISILFDGHAEFTTFEKSCYRFAERMPQSMEKFVANCFDESPIELEVGMVVYGRLPIAAKGCQAPPKLNPRPAEVKGHGFGRIVAFKMDGVAIDFGFGESKSYFYTSGEVLKQFTLFKDAPAAL
jgi:hypothetical protein